MVCSVGLWSLSEAGLLVMGSNESINWHGGSLQLDNVGGALLVLTGNLDAAGLNVGGLSVLPDGFVPSSLAGGANYNHAETTAFFTRLQYEFSLATRTLVVEYQHALTLLPVVQCLLWRCFQSRSK